MMRRDEWRRQWSQLRTYSSGRFAPESRPFPTPAQLDLLRAALLPAEQAAPAWRRWKGRGLELQTVPDEGSMRLFPLLWANRDEACIDAQDLPLLKGVYRSTFAANAGRIGAAIESSRVLDNSAIPTMFIKGAAMIAIAGDRLGLRRIDDVDLLVPEEHTERAITALLAAGHETIAGCPIPGVRHAWTFKTPRGSALDLHSRAFKFPGDDNVMFANATDATLLHQPVLISSPTDLLINTVVNGFHVGGAPVRWIADTVMLIDSTDTDWDYLLERARRPGLTRGLAAGLDFLRREFSASVPAYVLDELGRRPVGWLERSAHWAAVHGPPGAEVVQDIAHHQARRLHSQVGVPRDYLGHWAQASGRRRHEILWRAPRFAARSVAALLIRVASRHTKRAALPITSTTNRK
jgi:hypothetical protein